MTLRLSSLLCGLALLLLTPAAAFAQEGTITGTVTDAETGDPLPGATVQIEELTLGTATSVDGEYTLEEVPAGTHVIAVSFVGYVTIEEAIEVEAGETLTKDFELAPSSLEAEELVVRGYRVSPQRVETGSISTVTGEELGEITARSADKALQGRAAGVRVTALSGQPGSAINVQVRGANSIGSGVQPLFIIDGVQINPEDNSALSSGNPLTAINPADIESIEVLKDAAATSIYGANGANGVVIITTKTGREGRTTVSFSSQFGTTDRTREYDVFNAREYGQYWRDAVINRFGNDDPSTIDFANRNFGNPDSVTTDTDWQDAAFRTGVTQQYDVSINGGNESTRFFVSGRYTNDEGQVIASEFEQFSLRVNLDHDVNERLSVETRTQLAAERRRGTIGGGAFINSPFWSAQFIAPISPVFNNPTPENGFAGDPEAGFNSVPGTFGVFSFNPVQQETLNDRNSDTNVVITQVAANLEILDGFFSRTLAAVSHEDGQEDSFRDPRIPAQAPGSVSAFDGRQTSFNLSQSFSYTGRIGEKHDVGGLAVTEYREQSFNNISAAGDQVLPDFRTVSNAGEPTGANSGETEFRQLSFVADGDYTYDGRYQVRGTVRVDGNSRFGEDNRFGVFGAVSAFWRISEESFMEDVSFLDDLRLRASYGETGNSDIGNFSSRPLAVALGEYRGQPGVAVSQLGNPGLTWERVEDINLGLDYAVFGGRINGAIDVYRRDRVDQLLGRDLPDDSGYSTITENVAETRSQGVEFFIETTNIDYEGFRWSTTFNIAFQDTEVIDVGGEGRDIDDDGDVDEITVGGLVYREGEEVGQYRTPIYAGVNPANGRPMYRTPEGELTYFPAASDAINQPLVGNLQADFFGGFGNTFSYKGLQLDMFWQFDYGRTTLDNNFFFNAEGWNFNKNTEWSDYWRQPGDVTDTPAPFLGGTYADGTQTNIFTSRFFSDASYIRLKQLQLSYDLPQSLTQRVGLSRLQVFALGENIVTITDFTGPDPELVGTALGEFPQARTLTGGVRVEI